MEEVFKNNIFTARVIRSQINKCNYSDNNKKELEEIVHNTNSYALMTESSCCWTGSLSASAEPSCCSGFTPLIFPWG